MGQYYQPPPPGYGAPPPQPYGMVPPEVESIKSMLNIAGILCLIAGIILLLVGIFWIVVAGFIGAFIAIFFVIAAIFWIIFYMTCKGIIAQVDARQYEQAKSKTLLWMIIGLIFGFWPGLLLLIAYLKFDPLINATRAQGYGPVPQPYAQPPPQQRVCLGCGQQIPLNYNNCPHCGKAVQQSAPAQQHGGMRMCLGCGQQIQASYNVCPHCGKHMGQ